MIREQERQLDLYVFVDCLVFHFANDGANLQIFLLIPIPLYCVPLHLALIQQQTSIFV